MLLFLLFTLRMSLIFHDLFFLSFEPHKGPGKRGQIVADTLLSTEMFRRSPARATFVADTDFVSGTQKLFLILFRNILCPQQMFPSLRSPRNIMGNNVPDRVLIINVFINKYISIEN